MATCGDTGTGFLPANEARIKARDDWTIYCEIQAIQNAIMLAIKECSYNAIVNGQSPMTALNGINGVSVITGGERYFPVSVSALINHPSGTGAVVQANQIDGTIRSFNIIESGIGYDPKPLSIDASGLGNGDAVLQTSVNEGKIESVGVIVGGSGYQVGMSLPLVHPYGTGGEIEVLQVGAEGNILATRIVNSGSGYDTVFAEIVVSHPYGTGFTGTVIVQSSGVSGVNVTTGGVGYQEILPQVVFSDVSGVGASGTAIVEDGVITGIEMVSMGYNYTSETEVVIIPAPTSTGNGATAEIVQENGGCCVSGHCGKYDSSDYYAVWTGMETNAPIEDQLDYVQKYFTNLGYSIKPNTNPDTGVSLMWTIAW